MDFIDEFYKDEDLSLLKKLTLVIGTYNRNYYPSRCLWYHAHFPYGQIIVADSSPEEKKIINRETIEKVREKFGSNILYLEYENKYSKYSEGSDWKAGDAIQHVQTDYSQLCADKEFTIPTTQCKCINFLDKNQDYGSSDGRYYFAENHSKNKHTYYEGYKNGQGWSTKCSLPFTNTIDRYLACTARANASTNLMSIHRTELHKEVYNNLVKYDIRDIRFGEIVPEFMTIIKAKHHYFADNIYNCRDVTNINKHGKPNLSESSCSRHPYLDQYIIDGVYEEYFKTAVDCFKDEMIKSGCDLKPDEIEEIINTTLPHALERRGYYGNVSLSALISKKLRSNPIGRTLIFPPVQLIYNRFIIKSDSKQMDDLPQELKIIDTIITQYDNYHDTDMPII